MPIGYSVLYLKGKLSNALIEINWPLDFSGRVNVVL